MRGAPMIGVLRLFNAQGLAGLAACCCLAVLLVLQKIETRHARKESARFEQSFREAEAARGTLIADVAAAAEAARASDRANAARIVAKQSAINDRSMHDLQTRLARARVDAERLRQASVDQDFGRAGVPHLPGVPGSASEPADAASEDGFPLADRLLATEQAIQLDELIKWVRQQSTIKPDDQ